MTFFFKETLLSQQKIFFFALFSTFYFMLKFHFLSPYMTKTRYIEMLYYAIMLLYLKV